MAKVELVSGCHGKTRGPLKLDERERECVCEREKSETPSLEKTERDEAVICFRDEIYATTALPKKKRKNILRY